MLAEKNCFQYLFNSCYVVGNKNAMRINKRDNTTENKKKGTRPVINLKVQLMEFNN